MSEALISLLAIVGGVVAIIGSLTVVLILVGMFGFALLAPKLIRQAEHAFQQIEQCSTSSHARVMHVLDTAMKDWNLLAVGAESDREFVQFLRFNSIRLGRVKSYGAPHQISVSAWVGTAGYVVPVIFEKATGEVGFQLVSQGEQWVIRAMNVTLNASSWNWTAGPMDRIPIGHAKSSHHLSIDRHA